MSAMPTAPAPAFATIGGATLIPAELVIVVFVIVVLLVVSWLASSAGIAHVCQ